MDFTNGIVLYLEDVGEDGVRITGRAVGNPDQSKELANDIVIELFGTPDIEIPMASNQSMH